MRITMKENPCGYAFNKTRQTFLASDLLIADSHWKRLKGLLGTSEVSFFAGKGLWIVPCHGVHTLGMRYAIDVIYLSDDNAVVHVEEHVKPWRFTPIHMGAETVIELPAHTVCNTQTRIGDQIEISRVAATVASRCE